jgi:hypothetical protein
MIQALYAHMNNKKIKIKKKDCDLYKRTQDLVYASLVMR